MKRRTSKIQPVTTTISPSSTYDVRNLDEIKSSIKAFTLNIRKKAADSSESLSEVTRKNKNFKRFIPIALLLILVGGVILMAGRLVIASAKPNTTDSRSVVQGPKATITLNKDYSFPILDSKGKEVTKLKYTIQNAELRNEIIVKGSKATAIQGRTFLILNIKIVNDYEKGIDINARDYVRLTVNGNDNEQMAADIHNDPVSVQPISTKITRLGFPINDSDKNIVLKVGEIKGDKQSVPLNFTK